MLGKQTTGRDVMINFICGLLGTVVLSLFLGGLAYSIWENTGSIAFPVIVGAVLIMAYADFLQSLLPGKHKG